MLDYGIAGGILSLVTLMANRTTRPERWKYEAQILEWGDGEGDIQIIVNADALNENGEDDGKAVFPASKVEEVQNKTEEIADAIVGLFNATAKAEGKPDNWYVYSEPTWWYSDNCGVLSDDTDNDSTIRTIQWCIFNG